MCCKIEIGMVCSTYSSLDRCELILRTEERLRLLLLPDRRLDPLLWNRLSDIMWSFFIYLNGAKKNLNDIEVVTTDQRFQRCIARRMLQGKV